MKVTFEIDPVNGDVDALSTNAEGKLVQKVAPKEYTDSSELFDYIFSQMILLGKREISLQEAQGCANMAKQANNTIRERNKIKLMELVGRKAITIS